MSKEAARDSMPLFLNLPYIWFKKRIFTSKIGLIAMAYHLIIYEDTSHDSFILDIFLGSATTLDFYWESIGRALNLPFISSITEKADYEEGFILVADDLALFKRELEIFEKYWMAGDSSKGLPDGFLQKIKVIMEGVDNAIKNGFTLAIA